MTKNKHSGLWLYFAILVFSTITLICFLLSILWTVLYKFGAITADPRMHRLPIIFMVFGSLLIGGAIAIYVGRKLIRPIQNISNAFEALSKGDFSVRVPENENIMEIREMAKRFNTMVQDLSHVETLRTDFIESVSHEFKTPITSIEGYATLLQNDRLSPEKHNHYVEIIIENSRRLSNLSSSILMLSKLENQEIIPNKAEYRIDEQIRKAILMLEGKWEIKNIDFDMELPRQLYYGNEQLLERVWSNIIDNAIKYSPENNTIHVFMNSTDEATEVVITDHGEGMINDVQKHIFEKFYQGDPSRKSEGNGLGLPLVKRIVELCKGTITVKSTPGEGSTFTVTLPNKYK